MTNPIKPVAGVVAQLDQTVRDRIATLEQKAAALSRDLRTTWLEIASLRMRLPGEDINGNGGTDEQ